MRKPISILLLALYLLNATECNQLLKIPVFFAHLQEHRAADPHISLMQFVFLHYFNGDDHDNDYKRDMELPFKSHAYLTYATSPVLPSSHHITLSVVTTGEVQVSYPAYINTLHPLTQTTDIWQPPRQA